MSKEAKFLIIRFSSIGDIVLTSPVIRCLKKQVAGVEVHYLTKPQYQQVIAYNPYIDKILLLKDKLSDTIEEIKMEKYDYIIDLHHNIRTRIIKSRVKNLTFSFNKLNLQKWLIVNFKINRLPDAHIVDRYLDTVSVFDVKNDHQGLDYYNSKDNMPLEVGIPEFARNGYVGLVIGAKHETKKMPISKLKELANKIKHPFVIIGGPEDAEVGAALEKTNNSQIFNSCGKFSINESAELVRQARIVISHDTGFMHIAAAFRKKVISVWGNTIPEFGMYPYFPGSFSLGKDFWIIEEKLSCRPCSKIGYEKCPKGHFNCMNNIHIDKIVDIVNDNWNAEKN